MSALVLDVVNVKNLTVVRVSGRIVLGDDLPRLEQAIAGGLQGSTEVVVNLGGVDYVDSSGLGALVRTVTAARAKRKKILLCGLTPNVVKLFNLTRVTDLFQVFKTEEEALAAEGSAPRIPAMGSPTGVRVLVVDESLDMLAYLRNTLQNEGYQVLASSNFPDAKLFLKSAQIVVFGPDPVPCGEGSSVDTLRKLAPHLPLVSVQMNSDAAEMSADVIAQVKNAAKDLRT